jgi:hypothetical protein
MPKNNRLDSEQGRIPEEFRFKGKLDSLPDYCDCVELFGSMNRHRMQRVRNDKGVIKFCPKTFHGYIQLDASGVILDGVFRGRLEGD